jgi:hypothetical protein
VAAAAASSSKQRLEVLASSTKWCGGVRFLRSVFAVIQHDSSRHVDVQVTAAAANSAAAAATPAGVAAVESGCCGGGCGSKQQQATA